MVELKRFVINLKTLDQDIPDTNVVGAGDADGRTLSVIFTQEAAARLTPSTLVYLSWKHLKTGVQGLEVFTKVKDKPATWEIHYPQSMLYEGDVLACIKLIDEISISTTVNFHIHVLSDPNEPDYLEENDSYNIFKQAALELANTNRNAIQQMEEQQLQFEEQLASLKELEIWMRETVGELPEGVNNYLEYVEQSQKKQDEDIDKKIQDALDAAQLYTNISLQLNEF